MNITKYIKAGQPCLSINTAEINRAIQQTKIDCDKFQRFMWDCQRGIIDLKSNKLVEEIQDMIELMRWLNNQENAVLFAANFNHFFDDVMIFQELLNSINIWKASFCCFVIVGTNIKLPSEIESFFISANFARPDQDELLQIANSLGDPLKIKVTDLAPIEAAQGLTEFEAETAFALSLQQAKKFDPEIIIEQKKQLIKRSGMLEFYPPEPIENLGGLDEFKAHIKNRAKAFEPDSKLPKPRAILLTGIPGTGKSLSCKCVASILGWPLIRLDIGRMKGSLVGQSEENLRKATQTAEAFGTAVLWMDEVEKMFAGASSSGFTDGGTSANMFADFLTWMQETTANILIMATANDISNLPPEFLRRFNAIFFVDMPTESERKEIIDIMNRRYGSEISQQLAPAMKDWTGAEIEKLAEDSLFDGIEIAFKNTVPLSTTMSEKIKALQKWAKTRARRANRVEIIETQKQRRTAQ